MLFFHVTRYDKIFHFKYCQDVAYVNTDSEVITYHMITNSIIIMSKHNLLLWTSTYNFSTIVEDELYLDNSNASV